MTETAQERDERRAEIILEAIARTDGSDDAGGNSRHAAKLIAASDAAVGMDYDALRKLVGEILDEAIKCRDILESRELLDVCAFAQNHGVPYTGPQIRTTKLHTLIARAQEVLK